MDVWAMAVRLVGCSTTETWVAVVRDRCRGPIPTIAPLCFGSNTRGWPEASWTCGPDGPRRAAKRQATGRNGNFCQTRGVETQDDLGDGLTIGSMVAGEVSTLARWAVDEGWNPGLGDLDAVWDLQPAAFVALRQGSNLVGGGTILDYGGGFGFMGLFIVEPAWRGRGLGGRLWTWRRDRLHERLGSSGVIGMDGVVALEPFYARGGFIPAYRNIRMAGLASGPAERGEDSVVTLAHGDLDRFAVAEAATFPVAREAFWTRWLAREGVQTVGLLRGDTWAAFGVLRPCVEGFKLGPVVADDPDAARMVVSDLLARIEGSPVQWDVPEANPAAMVMARDFGLVESFACSRMYLGRIPSVDTRRLYGVASFEFG